MYNRYIEILNAGGNTRNFDKSFLNFNDDGNININIDNSILNVDRTVTDSNLIKDMNQRTFTFTSKNYRMKSGLSTRLNDKDNNDTY